MSEIQMDENQNQIVRGYSGIDHVRGQDIFYAPKDWEYAMRREMQEIIPGLYLGPYAAALKSKLNVLQREGITHIVCIRQTIEAHFIRPNFPDYFKYLVLDISDSPTENIIHHFRQAKQFIDDGLAQGGKVLVHGNSGICRSAAIVIAYVMVKYFISCSDALTVVRNHRFCVCINESFLQQLTEYEHIYKAEHQIELEMNSAQELARGAKRKREEEVEEEPVAHSSSMAVLPQHDSM